MSMRFPRGPALSGPAAPELQRSLHDEIVPRGGVAITAPRPLLNEGTQPREFGRLAATGQVEPKQMASFLMKRPAHERPQFMAELAQQDPRAFWKTFTALPPEAKGRLLTHAQISPDADPRLKALLGKVGAHVSEPAMDAFRQADPAAHRFAFGSGPNSQMSYLAQHDQKAFWKAFAALPPTDKARLTSEALTQPNADPHLRSLVGTVGTHVTTPAYSALRQNDPEAHRQAFSSENMGRLAVGNQQVFHRTFASLPPADQGRLVAGATLARATAPEFRMSMMSMNSKTLRSGLEALRQSDPNRHQELTSAQTLRDLRNDPQTYEFAQRLFLAQTPAERAVHLRDMLRNGNPQDFWRHVALMPAHERFRFMTDHGLVKPPPKPSAPPNGQPAWA